MNPDVESCGMYLLVYWVVLETSIAYKLSSETADLRRLCFLASLSWLFVLSLGPENGLLESAAMAGQHWTWRICRGHQLS